MADEIEGFSVGAVLEKVAQAWMERRGRGGVVEASEGPFELVAGEVGGGFDASLEEEQELGGAQGRIRHVDVEWGEEQGFAIVWATELA